MEPTQATLTHTSTRHTINLTDGPIVPMTYSSVQGRMVQLTSIHITLDTNWTRREDTVSYRVFGDILRKNGTRSEQRTDWSLWREHTRDAELITQIRELATAAGVTL